MLKVETYRGYNNHLKMWRLSSMTQTKGIVIGKTTGDEYIDLSITTEIDESGRESTTLSMSSVNGVMAVNFDEILELINEYNEQKLKFEEEIK